MKTSRIKREDGTYKVISFCQGTSMTLQSERDHCDVRKIMEKHKRTGIVRVNKFYEKPQYGDFSNPIDYQNAQNTIIKAHDQFDALPAAIREKFGNDPVQFLEFCTDEANEQAMIDMGIKAPHEKFETASKIDSKEEANGDTQKSPEADQKAKKGA
jgi:phage internal scaffolding protein